jgi:hypothetical protein
MEDSSDFEEEEEEVTFVPISLGTAEASMPEYLKVCGLLELRGGRWGVAGGGGISGVRRSAVALGGAWALQRPACLST